MVAKIITGKHISGIIAYNEHKVGKDIAKLLLAANFSTDAPKLSLKNKLCHFEAFAEKNRRTKTNAVHISLNFDNADKLSDELILDIGKRYMADIGFAQQPYLIYRHYDAAHPHVHIVTTNIQSNGQRIDLHNIGINKSENARKELEREFGLVQAGSKRKAEKEQLKEVDIDKVLYGKHETKQAISNIVRYVSRNWKYTSLPELNAVLGHYNVVADRGTEHSRMFEKNGLVYSLLDGNGLKIGVPIKASNIYGKPTLNFLESRYKLNDALRQPSKQQLKNVIDEVLKSPVSRNGFERKLQEKGVKVLFRQNEDGRVYGVTYADFHSKSVFNGSALGKNYSAKAIMEGFIGEAKSNQKFISEKTGSAVLISASSLSNNGNDNSYFSHTILNDLLRTEYEGSSIALFQNKRKKKKRKLNP
ncbi:MAG: Relaxase/mobilization nuclease family protein [Daejeonella sp.]|nr:Relaxase/mobilization nuclease family protein [Daejeonella sp.]